MIRWAGLAALVSLAIPAIATAQTGGLSRSSLIGARTLGSISAGAPTLWEDVRQTDHTVTVRKAEAAAEAALRASLALRPVRAAAPGPILSAAAISSSAPLRSGSLHADWYAIAQCESSGRWDLNSGNGFWGGLQFTPHTWFAYGGGPFNGVGPFPYSASQQISVAERVLAGQGPGAWPYCFRSA